MGDYPSQLVNALFSEPSGIVSPQQDYRDTYEAAIQYAADNNLVVNHPDGKTLLLDLDTPEQVAAFESIIPLFNEKFSVKDIKKTISKNGNTHVYLTLDRFVTVLEAIAMQAVLGSDPKRELLSLYGWLKGVPYPSLLFEVVDKR